MRGGAFFNGKEGRDDFRKNLRFQGSTFSFSNVKKLLLFFSNVNKVLVGFRKTLLMLRRFFESLFKPYFLKK